MQKLTRSCPQNRYNVSGLCKLSAIRICIHFCRDCVGAKGHGNLYRNCMALFSAWFRCIPGQDLTCRVGHDIG